MKTKNIDYFRYSKIMQQYGSLGLKIYACIYICIQLFLSLRVIQSIYATRLHRFGSFD